MSTPCSKWPKKADCGGRVVYLLFLAATLLACEALAQPQVCVTKEIACALPQNQCGPFSKLARGAKGDQAPAFCFRITVRNCGSEALADLTVIDTLAGDLTTEFFPANAPLAAGAAVTRTYQLAAGRDTTNTVTVSGRGSVGGALVSANDYAAALVETASILCSAFVLAPDDLDGDPHNEYALLPSDGSAHTVMFEVTVSNVCNVRLTGVTINAPALAALGCTQPPAAFDLAVGGSAQFILCTAQFSCPLTNAFNIATATGAVDPAWGCAYGLDGRPITVSSDGIAFVECTEVDPFAVCGRCPTAVAKVSPNCQLRPDQSMTVIIARNNSKGCVVLDGSQSSDPDGSPLTYSWLADLDHNGQTETIATGAVATRCLPPGRHDITLVVDNGRCSTNTSTTVLVITACEAVEAIIAAVDRADLGRKNKRPLIISLKAACASFDRGNCHSGVEKLQAFLHKVRAQVVRLNPAVAAELTALTRSALDCIHCKRGDGNHHDRDDDDNHHSRDDDDNGHRDDDDGHGHDDHDGHGDDD